MTNNLKRFSSTSHKNVQSLLFLVLKLVSLFPRKQHNTWYLHINNSNCRLSNKNVSSHKQIIHTACPHNYIFVSKRITSTPFVSVLRLLFCDRITFERVPPVILFKGFSEDEALRLLLLMSLFIEVWTCIKYSS
jgi:hypothetical protein